MKVSVALATYNGAEYLAEQLDSFVRQDRQPDELIISDDASTDGTVRLLEAFAETAPFSVRIERKPANTGYIRNFDTALSLCTGDLIFLSDQDDVWFTDKIAAATAALERHPAALLFVNDAQLVDEHLRPLGSTTFAQVRARGWSERAFTQGSCFALRRELLEWVLPLPDAYPFHDIWISDLANDLSGVLIDERPLQLFRRHSANASVMTVPAFHGDPSRGRGLGDSGHGRGQLHRLSAALRADVRPKLEQRVAMTTLRLERLRAVSGEAPTATRTASAAAPRVSKRAASAIGALERSLQAMEARLAVLGRLRLSRPPLVVGMLKRGDYEYFSGLSSALLDLVRK